jgi:predicted Fe-Mo cluster-binding NifX family protein
MLLQMAHGTGLFFVSQACSNGRCYTAIQFSRSESVPDGYIDPINPASSLSGTHPGWSPLRLCGTCKESEMKKWLTWILFLAVMGSLISSASEANAGRIAVASDEKAITGPVAFRMGRSAFYLVFDGEGKFIEAIDNPFKDAGDNAAGKSGKSALDSLQFDEKGGLTGGIETPPKEDRDKIWNSLLGFLASKGITVVVAEQFGYQIIEEMKKNGITCIEFKGKSVDGVDRALLSEKKNK